jgi:hypothetical protein
VEAEIDRIGLQLEDPRFHPDRMEAAVGAMTQLQGAQMPMGPESAGGAFAPPQQPPGAALAAQGSMEAAGVPEQELLANAG